MDPPTIARRAAHRAQATLGDRGKRTVKLGLSACLFAVDTATAAVVPRRRRGRRSVGVVLMYHDVAARHRARFARQCDTIVRLGRPASLAELSADSEANPTESRATNDPEWKVAVTFDDGFRSFAQVAVPELERCGIPSTMFVPTEWARRSTEREGDPLALVEPDGSPVPMTPAELAQLPGSVELGSHGRTHVPLPTLDDHTLRRELIGSRDELGAIAGTTVRFHAFPYGERDDRVDAAAAEAGFARCFGIAPAEVRANGDYVVGRVQVDPTDWPVEFRLKVLGAYRWMSWWMTAKERLRAASETRETREKTSTGATS